MHTRTLETKKKQTWHWNGRRNPFLPEEKRKKLAVELSKYLLIFNLYLSVPNHMPTVRKEHGGSFKSWHFFETFLTCFYCFQLDVFAVFKYQKSRQLTSFLKSLHEILHHTKSFYCTYRHFHRTINDL